MMTKLLAIVTMGAVVAGCVGPGPMTPLVCEEIKQKPCKGEKNSASVEIKTKWYNKKKLNFKPECVIAAPGTSIVFNIKLKGQSLNSAEIIPEISGNGWLNEKNDKNSAFIVVNVPADASGPYKYNFKADGWCADPRVHVEN